MVEGLKEKAGPMMIVAAAAAIAGYIIYKGKSGKSEGKNSGDEKNQESLAVTREPTQEDDLPQFNWLDEQLS